MGRNALENVGEVQKLEDYLRENGGGTKLALRLSTDKKKITRQSIDEKSKNGWVVQRLDSGLFMYNPKHFTMIGE